MKIYVALLMVLKLVLLSNFSGALICWTCENARSKLDCRRHGQWITCLSNQGACQNEVRRDSSGVRITKRCKQAQACENNFLQNPRAAWTPSQCNPYTMNSVCRCCCNFDRCNSKGAINCRDRKKKKPQRPNSPRRPKRCRRLHTLRFGFKICSKVPEAKIGSICKFSCNPGYRLDGNSISTCVYNARSNTATFDHEPPTCQQVPKVRECPDQGIIEHGNITCTDGNIVSSQCTFHCTEEGYELFPPGINHNRCLKNQMWYTLKPCCLQECPARAVMDLVIVLDSSSSIGKKNWKKMKKFVLELLGKFVIDPNAVQASIFRYNRDVDTDSEIFLSTSADKSNLKSVFDLIPYDGEGTLTGQALLHAWKHIKKLRRMHGSGEVTDVVLVLTDGVSQDEVKEPSTNLRSQGIATFAIGINPPLSNLNETQLMQIAGNNERLLLLNDGFKGLNRAFSVELTRAVCTQRCDAVFRDEI